jgi:hypothetical protein
LFSDIGHLEEELVEAAFLYCASESRFMHKW